MTLELGAHTCRDDFPAQHGLRTGFRHSIRNVQAQSNDEKTKCCRRVADTGARHVNSHHGDHCSRLGRSSRTLDRRHHVRGLDAAQAQTTTGLKLSIGHDRVCINSQIRRILLLLMAPGMYLCRPKTTWKQPAIFFLVQNTLAVYIAKFG